MKTEKAQNICANCFVWFSRATLAEPHRTAARKPCRSSTWPCLDTRLFDEPQPRPNGWRQ